MVLMGNLHAGGQSNLEHLSLLHRFENWFIWNLILLNNDYVFDNMGCTRISDTELQCIWGLYQLCIEYNIVDVLNSQELSL